MDGGSAANAGAICGLAWRIWLRCGSMPPMIASGPRYYFWFYCYPKLLAEDGSRLV